MALKIIIDAIHTSLADSTVSYKIGRRYVDEQSDGHRVVWVPLKEANVAQKDVGGVKSTAAGGGEQRMRSITARQVTIATHIWAAGDTYETALLNAETLLENLIVAARKATNIGCQFESANWLSQSDASAGYDPRGEVVIAQWTMRLPVYDETKALTPISAAHHQGSMQFPGGTHAATVTTSENTCSS